MASVQLQHICKSYDGGPAVINDVSLDIADGEFCVFVGPSGCGKSTLLRMVAGLEDISAGDLHIGARRVNQLAPSERNIAMVFQSYALYPHMDVRANIAFGLGLAGHAKAEIAQRVQRIAEVLQIVPLLDSKPRSLSGGQRQRVAIGRALVRDPGVFLFDEPLSNLDASLRTHMRVEIARLHRQYGKASTIYVTHDQVEAMTLADKIVLLHSGADIARHGSVAQAGSPLELYHHPRNRFVAGFIGSPQMNFLDAKVEQAAMDGVRLRTAQGVALRVMVEGARLAPGAPVSLGVRAEHLQLRAAAQDNTLPCRVLWVERLGDTTYAYLETGDAQQLVARVDSEREIGVGDALHAWLPPQACHLFDADGVALARLNVPHQAAA